MARRSLRHGLAAALAHASSLRSAAPFPLFYNADGGALLTSTRGADVLLQPDVGGARARPRVRAAARREERAATMCPSRGKHKTLCFLRTRAVVVRCRGGAHNAAVAAGAPRS
jgi:hypothetical protein